MCPLYGFIYAYDKIIFGIFAPDIGFTDVPQKALSHSVTSVLCFSPFDTTFIFSIAGLLIFHHMKLVLSSPLLALLACFRTSDTRFIFPSVKHRLHDSPALITQICPALKANEIQISYDKHHKVCSSVKSYQTTNNSSKYK